MTKCYEQNEKDIKQMYTSAKNEESYKKMGNQNF